MYTENILLREIHVSEKGLRGGFALIWIMKWIHNSLVDSLCAYVCVHATMSHYVDEDEPASDGDGVIFVNCFGPKASGDNCVFESCTRVRSSGDGCNFSNCTGVENSGDSCVFTNTTGSNSGRNPIYINSNITGVAPAQPASVRAGLPRGVSSSGPVRISVSHHGTSVSSGALELANIGIIHNGSINGVTIPSGVTINQGVPHFRGAPLTRENLRVLDERPDLVVFLDEFDAAMQNSGVVAGPCLPHAPKAPKAPKPPKPPKAPKAPKPPRPIKMPRTPRTPTSYHRDIDRGIEVVVLGDSDDSDTSGGHGFARTVRGSKRKQSDSPSQRKHTARPAAAGPSAPAKIPTLSAEEKASLKDEKKDASTSDIPRADECVVCCTRARNTVFLGCGHNAACLVCVHKIEDSAKAEGKQGKCPVCMQVYSGVVKYVKS